MNSGEIASLYLIRNTQFQQGSRSKAPSRVDTTVRCVPLEETARQPDGLVFVFLCAWTTAVHG